MIYLERLRHCFVPTVDNDSTALLSLA